MIEQKLKIGQVTINGGGGGGGEPKMSNIKIETDAPKESILKLGMKYKSIDDNKMYKCAYFHDFSYLEIRSSTYYFVDKNGSSTAITNISPMGKEIYAIDDNLLFEIGSGEVRFIKFDRKSKTIEAFNKLSVPFSTSEFDIHFISYLCDNIYIVCISYQKSNTAYGYNNGIYLFTFNKLDNISQNISSNTCSATNDGSTDTKFYIYYAKKINKIFSFLNTSSRYSYTSKYSYNVKFSICNTLTGEFSNYLDSSKNMNKIIRYDDKNNRLYLMDYGNSYNSQSYFNGDPIALNATELYSSGLTNISFSNNSNEFFDFNKNIDTLVELTDLFSNNIFYTNDKIIYNATQLTYANNIQYLYDGLFYYGYYGAYYIGVLEFYFNSSTTIQPRMFNSTLLITADRDYKAGDFVYI